MARAVSTVQYKLLSFAASNPAIGITSLDIDDKYGPATHEAIKKWMRATPGVVALVGLYDSLGPSVLSAWMNTLGLTPAMYAEFINAWKTWHDRQRPAIGQVAGSQSSIVPENSMPDYAASQTLITPRVVEAAPPIKQSGFTGILPYLQKYWWVPTFGAVVLVGVWLRQKRKSAVARVQHV
jgi:hypothetical protein